MNPESHEISFYKKLSDLKELYEKVKYAIILSENFDPEQKFSVAPCNQLRSALDHIFKAIDSDEETMEYEIKEAKEHLVRAGYDVYEILASNMSYANILKKMDKYPPNIVSIIFPEYYKKIKFAISNIQIDIAKLRKNKMKSIDMSFEKYMKNIEEIIGFDKQINEKIPALELALEDHKKHDKRQKLKYWAGTILLAIIMAVISLIVNKYISR